MGIRESLENYIEDEIYTIYTEVVAKPTQEFEKECAVFWGEIRMILSKAEAEAKTLIQEKYGCQAKESIDQLFSLNYVNNTTIIPSDKVRKARQRRSAAIDTAHALFDVMAATSENADKVLADIRKALKEEIENERV